jgi:hypothetical protein
MSESESKLKPFKSKIDSQHTDPLSPLSNSQKSESESIKNDESRDEKSTDHFKSDIEDSEGINTSSHSDDHRKKRLRDSTITNASFLKGTLDTTCRTLEQRDFTKSVILTLQELVTIRNELSTLLEEEEQRNIVLCGILPKCGKLDDLKKELVDANPVLLNNKKMKHDDKQYDKNKICGVLNSRQKPCQRTGFCPFHGGRKQQEQKEEDDQNSAEEWEEDWPEEASKDEILEARKIGKDYMMTVSVLLIAAAALEKEQLERQTERPTPSETVSNPLMKL